MISPESAMNGASLYQQALGPAFSALAPSLRRFHGSGQRHVQGTLRVRVGSHPLARAFLWLGRLPGAHETAAACHLRLSCDEDEKSERWDRRIGPHRIISIQKLVASRAINQERPSSAGTGEIIERFGLLTLDLLLRVKQGNLWLRSRAARFAGVSLPAWFAIRVVARERAVGADSFHVDVRVSSPLTGCLLKYRGMLRLDAS